MSLHVLHRVQMLPISVDDAWAFYSDPQNLRTITPASLDFQITSHRPAEMCAGTIITYTVRPLLGIKVRWVTEITHMRPPHFFVDEQRLGPYRFWHHKHIIAPIEGGVRIEDIVHYQLPGAGILEWMHPLIVAPELKRIFDHRHQVLNDRFGVMPRDADLTGDE
jgi:ligand-binding SRPBCC domain-containing protein